MSAWRVSRWRSSARTLAARFGLLALFAFCVAWARPADSGANQQKAEAVTCATCHGGVARSYAGAPMRHAMEPADANPTLNAHPDLSVQIGAFHYSVQTRDGKSTYSVSDGNTTLTLPIRWVFGEHSQTFVLEKDGRLYETLVSYFPRENGLATTPGDEALKPATLSEAMGRELSPWESRSCFNCHASNATQGTGLTLDKLTPGLNCERCHEGAQRHMADAANENFKTLPRSFKRMSTLDISNFCGQCHRSWETVVRNRWKGPAFVRFQPYRLQNSKCFAADDPRISCLACHNPHQQVNHAQAFYDGKCLACHGETRTAAAGGEVAAKSCPVSKSNCSNCHMPKVELPGGHARFTDHHIRIVRPGDPYPN